jgi:ABC-2 type transport system ATP-binding protein
VSLRLSGITNRRRHVPSDDARSTTPANAVVVARGLGRRYGRQWALRDVDLDLTEGEILGFIGPNGAGKSTFLKLLAGLTLPTAGHVEVLGSDPARHVSDDLGLVAEHMGLVPNLSARRNLQLIAAIRRRADDDDISRTLEIVGLDPLSRKPVHGFSLGMRQRLLVAQALMERPRLLLLDEPTNGLDPEAIVALRELLRRLADEDNVTIVLASHLLTEVERVCDRVLLVARGEIRRRLDLRDMRGLLLRIEPAEAIAQLERHAAERGIALERLDETSEVLLRDPRPVPQVLHELLDAGLPIVEARPARASLEAEFLRILDGGAAL